MLSGESASATSINVTGTPVSGFNSNASVASLGANDYLEFFIPISDGGSGSLGVNGAGLVADVGFGGGKVTMYINFGIISTPLTNVKLTIDMIDVDLVGGNDLFGDGPDPDVDNFWEETVRVFGQNGFSTPVIDSLGDDQPGFFDVTGDFTNQQLTFSDISSFFTPSATTPFVLGLEFTSLTNPKHFGLNTSEFVRAHLSADSVPEPATLALLASGALVLRRRKRQA